MSKNQSISRDALLDAAEQVIAEGGASRLTLEAVAARARVSKGGLQYVFKSKKALIAAMIERFILASETDYKRERQRLGDDPRRGLEAYVRANFAGGEIRTVHSALMAAVLSEPELLAPLQSTAKDALVRLTRETGLSRARVAAVTLAADAIILLSVLRMDYLSKREKAEVMEELVKLAAPDVDVEKVRRPRRRAASA